MSNLSPQHRQMLECESGILPNIIEARGYRTVTVKADLERLGFGRSQRNVPALLIPIHNPQGEVALYQARPDLPRIRDGKAVKYETQAGARMALDVHPFARANLRDPKVPLFVTEGIKKGDALVSRGVCAVALIGVWNWRGTNEHGGKTALGDWEYIALNGRQVYIVFDSDVMLKLGVHRALVRLKAFLETRDARVSLIYLPERRLEGGGEEKQGVDDFLAAGHSIADLKALATKDLRAPPHDAKDPASEGASGLPKIQVNERHLRDIVADSLEALMAANEPPHLFQRGNTLVRVVENRIEVLSNTALKGMLDRSADFVTVKSLVDKTSGELRQDVKPARPPGDVAPDILTMTKLPFPELAGVATVPMFLPDGTLLATSGYDPESRLLLQLGELEGLSAELPLDEAKALLCDELLIDFPFAGEGALANALACLLQSFVRTLIRGPTPLYGIEAPTRGTGKGLLTSAMSYIVTGKPAPVMALPRDHDELEKRITAALLEGGPYMMLDNVVSLKTPALAAALTSEVWRGRRLGQSEIVTVPNTATWIATGNNIEVSDEIARRLIPIKLDAGLERPEERRDFKHPRLLEWVQENRPRLVSACLSIIQYWVNLGMPEGAKTLGSYESWSRVMGGILDAAGLPGFLGRREAIYQEADRETQEWKAVCDAWYERHGTLPVSANDVWDLCKERTLLLEMWGGRERLSALQRIGRALTRHRGRVYGACRIVGAGRDKTSGRARYRLEQVSRKTPETPETPSSVDHPADVLGVSDVFSAPPEPALSEESAQLRQRLLGATEGEL